MNVISISFGGGSGTSFVWSVGTAVAAGVVLFLLNWGREILTSHWKRNDEATVLAFTVASQLDDFISQCADVVANGYEIDEQSGQARDTANNVKISFSNDLPWSVFDKQLQHQIRSLPNELDVADRTTLASWEQDGAELLDVLQEREELYAKIGLKALKLNQTLSQRYDVPLLNRRDWSPEATFIGSLKEFSIHRAIVKSLSDKIDLPDLLPGSTVEELSRRHSALTVDLKAATDRYRTSSHV